MKKTILLGITGGIAAYKSRELLHELKKQDVAVDVILTDNALQMVNPIEIEKITGNKTYNRLFAKGFSPEKVLQNRIVDHIQLADNADLMVIAPATANSIAKLAYGLADDFLTTTVLAMTKPIILCPSMNVHMYQNPIVQHNISLLKTRGFIIIEPGSGPLACGYDGQGRLAETPIIVNEILRQLLATQKLKERKIIVTSGGTTEPIDSVRVITNKSSGKMGVAIAEELFLQGAQVLLIRSKNSAKPRYGLTEALFTTTQELSSLITKHSKQYDTIYHAAAVSDFSVVMQQGKLTSEKSHTLTLMPQEKIIQHIKRLHPSITLYAFKAVHDASEEQMITIGNKKLKQFSADAVIVNDVSKKGSGFESEENEVWVVTKKSKPKFFPLQPKTMLAKEIINYLG